ncbi:MAG: DJ-1/PfpI family protein [Oscillospiraceae bacterium]|jgi:4-methyl-5(b-hydroxyethyl)-thiazole monophosphate biosynthesis|nr:DJ-1/PfpI family protein [Oscillospiraceae bacterium]
MTVLLLLGKGFEHMETGVFIDIMGWAREIFKHDVRVTTCGYSREVISTFGVPIVVDTVIDAVRAEDYDALAIPGGFRSSGFFEEAYDSAFLRLIRDFDAQEKPIASVCTAALALGRSGILSGRRATTYHLDQSGRINELESYGVNVMRERLVTDGKIITSCGPSSAAEVAFALLEMLIGTEDTEKVRAAMGYCGK